MTMRRPQARMLGVAGLFGVLFAVLVARAVDLAVLRGPALARLAELQHRQRIELVPHRGAILDRRGEALALSAGAPSLYVRPREFAGQEARLPALAAVLRMPVHVLRGKLESKQPFVWLQRQVSRRVGEAVEGLGLRGVYRVVEGRRFYPHNQLAAHVLGFVGIDSQGLEGVERGLDRVIRGQPYFLEVDRDARGREMFTRGLDAPLPHGDSVELTIDAAVQAIAERELAAGVMAAKAAGGAAVVLDPSTGEVLALANVPTYNPNEPDASVDKQWRYRVRDRAITDPYEPGSTFKAILAAAAVEERVVVPSELFFCENGRLQLGKWTIHDAHRHGWLTFAEVIQYSSNIGASKVGDRLGRERYYRYLEAFGFGARTGIELPGESPGILRSVGTWSRIDLATHSFGQGVSVTPMQMATAFAAIANGGLLMRPYLVRRTLTANGDVTFENRPHVVRQVVSARTAQTVTALLRRVVEGRGGTGSKAAVDGFPVAGKTGTAQKVDPATGAYSSKRIGSFVGFLPADAPRIVVLVLIDEPTTSSYVGVVAAPVFRAIAGAVLTRLGVPPTWPTPVPATVRMAQAPRPRPKEQPGASPPVVPVRVPGTGDETPNFLGLSLREALTRAQEIGWDVEVRGTGYVREQTPAPGAPPAGDRRLALRLVPGEITARP